MLQPRGLDRIEALIDQGVAIPNPWTLDLADDVDIDRISGDGVVLHPGTRLRGASTVISAGCVLGEEGPVTVDSCQLGPGVKLHGGFARKAVFLEGASLGLGAHVREGSLLEEQSGGAHCVGLKQTILFPFATLGSLINFCDALLAGGTSRSNHSEVGSSYIHFNFTPDGDKSTASMFGDVPRGVLLDQAPIFLGGQGGAVGPVATGFGTVVGAGSILRGDVPDDHQLVLEGVHRNLRKPNQPASYRDLTRLVERNVVYLASLWALRAWYADARRPFFIRQELGPLVYEGAQAALANGVAERVKRLTAMIGKVGTHDEARAQLHAQADAFRQLFSTPPTTREIPEVLSRELSAARSKGLGYIDAVQDLSVEAKTASTTWLAGIVTGMQDASSSLVPALNLFAGDATN